MTKSNDNLRQRIAHAPQLLAALMLLLIASLFCGVTIADEAASSEPAITDSDRDHWSFLPLANPQVPVVKATAWPRNPIDHFILARLEKEELTPAPEADRVTLLRRVTLDLTGLTPKPEEVDAFVADQSTGAFERVIDRLLASPAYGERWAQHWLDLARFAETDGFEHDLVRPNAWKYRDWVIKALNDDMPYDEFVRLQIAGDLIKPGDESAAIATGFALAGPDMPDINLPEERGHMVLGEIASTVGSVLLGLQVGCAECHDHKFDPISQADFYRLRSFFASGLDFGKESKDRVLRERSDSKAPETFLMVRGDFRRPGPRVDPAYPRVANGAEETPSTPARLALAHWLTRAEHPLATRVIVNRLWQHHFARGLSDTPSDFGIMGSSPTHPELLDWLARELPKRGWSLKQMHKLMLTSATYQQASRLAESERADEKLRQSWATAVTKDPENRLLWSARRQRLSGEVIRDSMLVASERLSDRTGGPGVRPPLPEELVKTLLKDHWQVSPDEEDHRRRSVYLFARRNLRYPLFEVFDRPDASASCPRRSQSTTATQALTLLNSDFALACAGDLANYVIVRASDEQARIELAYRRTLARKPGPDELEHARKFLAECKQRYAGTAKSSDASVTNAAESVALTHLCLALFNLNEFVYVD